MKLPAFPVEGGCQCRAVRYRITAGPLGVYNCHCADCHRSSGAAYSMSMVMRREDVELLSGTLIAFDKAADSGRVVRGLTCATCGTRVWNEPQSFPEILVVKPGTLDDMSWAVPVANIWAASKAPWIAIDATLVNFAGQPPSRQPLYDAWTRYLTEG